MSKSNEPAFPACRTNSTTILSHNKGIFHLKQCPNCFSSETIELDKERRVLAGQTMMGLLASGKTGDSTIPITAIQYADALILELEKTEK
jgi:hypothetical protein